MTSSAQMSGGRQVTWTRENVIAAIRRWVECYGEPPRAADWNPSSARWCAQTWRIERYRKGDPDTGAPWPSLNAAKKPFGGSLNAALLAAGFEPNRSGPPKRSAVVLEAAVQMHPEARVAVEAAQAEVRRLEELVATRDRQLARAREARAARPPARKVAGPVRVKERVVTKTKTKVVTRVNREAVRAAVARAESRWGARLAKADDRAAEARAEAQEARTALVAARSDTARMVTKLRKAEDALSDAREDAAALRAAAKQADLDADVARRELAAAVAEADRLSASTKVIVKDAPAQAVIDAALLEARQAKGAAHEAEVRAAKAERDYLELAAASSGEARKLSKAELDELRASGPAGRALLAAALKDLARAKNPTATFAALTAVASAAVSWRERL